MYNVTFIYGPIVYRDMNKTEMVEKTIKIELTTTELIMARTAFKFAAEHEVKDHRIQTYQVLVQKINKAMNEV